MGGPGARPPARANPDRQSQGITLRAPVGSHCRRGRPLPSTHRALRTLWSQPKSPFFPGEQSETSVQLPLERSFDVKSHAHGRFPSPRKGCEGLRRHRRPRKGARPLGPPRGEPGARPLRIGIRPGDGIRLEPADADRVAQRPLQPGRLQVPLGRRRRHPREGRSRARGPRARLLLPRHTLRGAPVRLARWHRWPAPPQRVRTLARRHAVLRLRGLRACRRRRKPLRDPRLRLRRLVVAEGLAPRRRRERRRVLHLRLQGGAARLRARPEGRHRRRLRYRPGDRRRQGPVRQRDGRAHGLLLGRHPLGGPHVAVHPPQQRVRHDRERQPDQPHPGQGLPLRLRPLPDGPNAEALRPVAVCCPKGRLSGGPGQRLGRPGQRDDRGCAVHHQLLRGDARRQHRPAPVDPHAHLGY